MEIKQQIHASLGRLTFAHQETGFHHHSYDDDLYQYEFVKRGDLRSVEEGRRMFQGANTGSLADDPVRNYQYLFVASVTLACRFCIEGGLALEESFNLSDLYIRQVDGCRTVSEIFALHDAMMQDYTLRMQQVQHKNIYSRQIYDCLDSIDRHLHEPLTVARLAEELGLTPTYLSTLFKAETGTALSEYIRRKRIDAAKMLLQYTEFSCIEIAEYLCFSSCGHFSNVFRQCVGISPREFRNTHHESHWRGENPISGELSHT